MRELTYIETIGIVAQIWDIDLAAGTCHLPEPVKEAWIIRLRERDAERGMVLPPRSRSPGGAQRAGGARSRSQAVLSAKYVFTWDANRSISRAKAAAPSSRVA